MGEIEFKPNKLVAAVGLAVQQQELDAMRLDTPGGRIHVRWDEGGSATPSGQLVFFAECLEVTGLFSRWEEGCPLNYTSPNAARAKDLLGTWITYCWHFSDEPDDLKIWEYTVLVTNTDYPLEAIGQLYRDRADCENGFDELKNQWGWGGFTTQDLERCNLSARAVALIYNWWSWYVRLAHPKARLEAITSKPMLLAGVGRLTEHAGQTRLLVSLTHAAGDKIKAMIANIHKGFEHVRATAPQLPKLERWRVLVRYIIEKILASKPKNPSPISVSLTFCRVETG